MMALFVIFVRKKNMKIIIVTLIFLLSSTSIVLSQDKKAQDILNKVSSKMKALKCFYVEFNANVKSKNKTENQNGNGWVKGNKFVASYAGNTIISNGMKTWTIIKDEKTVYESDANNDSESVNPKKIMTIWETGFKNKYEKEEVLDGDKVHIIYLYPKDPKKVDYHTVILYITKTGLDLKKAVMKTKDGTVMTYTLTNFIENAAVDDTKFVIDLKKYPGYKVVKD